MVHELNKATWLAAYLYYGEPWEVFLRQPVALFVEDMVQAGLAEQFFFIRYWEQGPHIRLRLRGNAYLLEEKVRPRLTEYFLDYFAAYPSARVEPPHMHTAPLSQPWFANHSIHYTPYEPEVERYGGPTGMKIAEAQFDLSSRVSIALLRAFPQWSYEQALGSAIQLHLGFANSLGMSLHEARHFFAFVSQRWLPAIPRLDISSEATEVQIQTQVIRKAFQKTFIAQEASLVAYQRQLWQAITTAAEFEQAWFNDWLVSMQRIGQALREAQAAGQLALPRWRHPVNEIVASAGSQALWPIFESYVHMTNNRLGILNRDEAYLAYLLQVGLERIDDEYCSQTKILG